LIENGIDPIGHRKQLLAKRELESKKGMTFKQCAIACIEFQKSGWKSRKHESQWRNTLETYAYPVMGDIAVRDIDIGMVLNVLEPIWETKTETASRLRQRIEKVLDWSSVRQYRTGDNPARWNGHLEQILPLRSKVHKVKHFAALPYSDIPDYFRKLRKVESLASKALAFLIITATRSGEARGATWNEIDLDAGVWNIPPNRMKSDRPHRIPLTSEALKILNEVKPFEKDNFVFPGLGKDKPISDAAIRKLLKQSYPELTVHGFRSSFRDWCAEITNFSNEVAEATLAHVIKDKTEAAYRRGDLFVKRRKLMDTWTSYCINDKKVADVVPIKKKSLN
jgi:integrase